MAHAHSHAEEFDAHGHKDHGHVIVSIWTLRAILGALLFFTFATVLAAWAEEWIAATFNVVIPQWINAFVALSIAVVKTTLVVLFFMQLKYDNPLNSMIFIFTILTVAFFLGFTTLDLGNRYTVDRFKNVYVYDGGKLSAGGNVPLPEDPQLKARAEADAAAKVANPYVYVNLKPEESIVDRAFRLAEERRRLGITDEHEGGHGGHGHGDPALQGIITEAGYKRSLPVVGSSPDRARPLTGVTLPGLPPLEEAKDAKSPASSPAAPGSASHEENTGGKPAQHH